MKTLKEVQDALLGFLKAQLEADVPGIQTTHSIEAAHDAYENGQSFICCTQSARPQPQGRRQHWELLLQMSRSLYSQAQATTEASAAADRDLVDLVVETINRSRIALDNLGLYNLSIEGMPEDQQSEGQINPHLVKFFTL